MCGFIFGHGTEASNEKLQDLQKKQEHRGPDNQTILQIEHGFVCFQRLSIMDLSEDGNQPFVNNQHILVCNGEIYNYEQLKLAYSNYNLHSKSDCEIILALMAQHSILEVCQLLDGEFAFVVFDKINNKVLAGRDPMGIRPLFYGRDQEKIYFASEVKSLVELCTEIKPFPPGHYFDGEQILPYQELYKRVEYSQDKFTQVLNKINHKLTAAVKKRLISDAPVGFLLSGGLDSSLVCAIAQRELTKPIKTFSVGINQDPIDAKYAKIVADYLGTEHTEYLFSEQDVEESLRSVIYHLESWDITTIRASIGMYLICKYIRQNTNIKVLLTGEVSDELFGYKYTDFAPSEEEFQKEAEKRVKELYLYDVLRADRCIAAHSLEARVPFGDKDFVQYVMSVQPKFKMNKSGWGKFLLRKAFESGNYLPSEILYREKAAFSDAVGHRSVDFLKELAEKKYSDAEFKERASQFSHGMPFTKESLMYREIFEEFFKGQALLIPSFWMPNKEWQNCNVTDPSARVLPNYGKSGK